MIREAQRRNRTANKQQRNRFIPFANQRDGIGKIIRQKSEKKNDMNAIKIFQNLKKSTKEYLFDKHFEKMIHRFEMYQKSIAQHEIDYDAEFQKLHFLASELLQKKEEQKENERQFYLYSKEEVGQKIKYLKHYLECLKRKKQRKKFNGYKNQRCSSKKKTEINLKLFSKIGNRSKLMASFVNEGTKYFELVDHRNIDPLKKWYEKEAFEVFPGKDFHVKCLKKSLYD